MEQNAFVQILPQAADSFGAYWKQQPVLWEFSEHRSVQNETYDSHRTQSNL